MDKYIGRIKVPDEMVRYYRFPEPLLRTGVRLFNPKTDGNIYQYSLTRLRLKSRKKVRQLERACCLLKSEGVWAISIPGRSRYVNIRLDPKLRDVYTDIGNRWNKIEEILTKTFKLSLRKIEDPRKRNRVT